MVNKDTVTLELTITDLNVIRMALGELKFKEVYPTVSRIEMQVQRQSTTNEITE